MIITDEQRQKRMEEFVEKITQNKLTEESIINEAGDEPYEETNQPDLNIPEKKTLTEILAELDRLDSYCDNNDEIEATMTELKTKVESIVHVLRHMESRINELDNDISELNKIKKVCENRRNNLENYLKISLTNAHFNSITTNTFDVRIKPSTALVVDKLADTLDLTGEDIKPYIVCKTSYQFDKNKIKDAIKLEILPDNLKPYFYISSDKNLNYKFRR